MEPRYIDANALLMLLADYQLQESPTWGANGYGNADKHEAISECIKAVEERPTADVRENVKGEWVKMTGMMPPEYHGHYECSLCGWHLSHHARTLETEFDFCPHCGADMR